MTPFPPHPLEIVANVLMQHVMQTTYVGGVPHQGCPDPMCRPYREVLDTTPDGRLVCPACRVSLKLGKNFRAHMKLFHPTPKPPRAEKPAITECECGMKFKTARGRQKHISRGACSAHLPPPGTKWRRAGELRARRGYVPGSK